MTDSKRRTKDPIIVFGTGRSGTTIISEALFRHEHLAFPSTYDERFPGRRSASYMRWVFDNCLWRYAGKKRQINGAGFFNRFAFTPGESYEMWSHLCRNEVDFSRGFLIDERLSKQTRQGAVAFFESMLRKQGRRRLAFKITGPSRMAFLLDLFPNARFIRITRDAVPTISSWLKVDFWQSKGRHRLWWQGAYSTEQEQWAEAHAERPHMLAALQFSKLMEVADREIEETQAAVLEVPYEHFVQAPSEWMNKMLNFCALDHSVWIDRYMENNPVVQRDRPGGELFSTRELNEIQETLNKKWK